MAPLGSAPGRRLILVRHSDPERRDEMPSATWPLSRDGIANARAFASRVDPRSAQQIYTSEEPKATGTARVLADAWRLPVETAQGLHEHERPEARILPRDVFRDRIRDLFARPAELVYGAETADQARRRFTAAVMRLIARTSGDVIVVSHGTVITLFTAEATGAEPFAFWGGLKMPCAVVLTIPELKLVELVREG